MKMTLLFLGIGIIGPICIAGTFVPEKHPAKSMKFWRGSLTMPFEKKLNQRFPPELLDYIRMDNKSNGWPNIPKPVSMEAAFEADVRAAINEIPEDIKTLINSKLLGVFFVSDLGGSGYSESIIDNTGQPVAGFVVLDITSLSRNANEWATWKEESPYKLEKGLRLQALIAKGVEDNRKNAIQYILLHEFGHILSIANPLLPRWGVSVKTITISPDMKFFNINWKVHDNSFVSQFDEIWSGRRKILYHAPEAKKLPGQAALATYRQLPQTNFPTPYAATNPFDDFADSFANYVHVVRLKKPWQIQISSSKEQITLPACWSEPRCREKKEIIEQMLQCK